jgi:hypothetical protein
MGHTLTFVFLPSIILLYGWLSSSLFAFEGRNSRSWVDYCIASFESRQESLSILANQSYKSLRDSIAHSKQN